MKIIGYWWYVMETLPYRKLKVSQDNLVQNEISLFGLSRHSEIVLSLNFHGAS